MSDNKPFEEVRAVFEKKGAAVFFSHLDLNRTVCRALRRSKMNIWLTKGYTPRPHLVFTPPLSLGYESECEIFDFRLQEGEKFDENALKTAFPEALCIKSVYTPKTKLKDITYAQWKINVCTKATALEVMRVFEGSLTLVKKTKRSESEVDIIPFIKKIECKNVAGGVEISAVLDCSNESTLSPSYILEGMRKCGIEFRYPKVTRTGFLDKDFNLFK